LNELDMRPPEELLERWRLEDEEARRIRRSQADWGFIESQPPKIREALKYLVERGDLYVASKIAGVTLDEINQLRLRARIPKVV